MIWVQDADDELALGSPAWQRVPVPVPADGEPLIHKHFNSSFELTVFEAERPARREPHRAGRRRDPVVQSRHRHRLCRTGARLRPHLDRRRAHQRHDDARRRHNGTTIEAAGVVRELNIAMTWLRYSGCASGTANAEQVDFAVAGGAR